MVVAAAVVLLIVSVLPLPLNLIGQEYAPNEDDGQFNITTEMPPGTSLASNSAAMARVEQALIDTPEVDSFTTTVGAAGSRGGGSDRNGTIAVQLVEKTQRERSVFEIMNEIRKVQQDIPGLQVRPTVAAALIGSGGSTPINLRLTGREQ